MRPSTHYYVLSLGRNTSALWEAFRDTLIEVENQGFPVVGRTGAIENAEAERRVEHARVVDGCFGRYHDREPLGWVVVGAEDAQSAFLSVTAHRATLIGRVDGDHTTTSARDLGQIVWPIVKVAMSGLVRRALHELDGSPQETRTAWGLEAVAASARRNGPSTLLVEEGYRRRGSLRGSGNSAAITGDVDVRATNDDAVDAVIEEVLEAGGEVVFTPPGSLQNRERIVLLLRDRNGARTTQGT